MKSFWYSLLVLSGTFVMTLAQHSNNLERTFHTRQCDEDFFLCGTGLCIPDRWVCDGDEDCGDGSNEQIVLAEMTKSGSCIPVEYICDGDSDCRDNSDELDPQTGKCPACPEYAFTCTNGRCLPNSKVCNGRNDCPDGSEEPNDPEQCPACPEDQFKCANNGHCIPKRWVCDGANDCGDNSDEPDNPDDCPACDSNQFRCSSTGRCISELVVCDGANNCNDWSDESEETCPCGDTEIRCAIPPSELPGPPGACIPAEFVCDEDGIWDCSSGSDEANCSKVAKNAVKVLFAFTQQD